MAKTLENSEKENANNVYYYYNVEGAVFRGSGFISKYRKFCYIMKCDYIIWLAFFLVETLVKIPDYFQKVSNFFSILYFSQ